MKYSDLKRTLKDHALRITDCRMDVLEMFQRASSALSFRDIEEELTGYDRVTLYRTLNSFIEKGVLHKIPDDSGIARYGACYETCTAHKHLHDHVHFKCEQCGKIECIPNHHVPKMKIPGYQIHSSSMIVKGYCENCVAV